MEESRSSRTALRVALRRAAHQMYDDKPLVFTDEFAVRLLGEVHNEELRRTPWRGDRPHSRSLRAWLVARSRYAEDFLMRAEVTQYVVLGAGLETFAMRNMNPDLRVFEVDHPATQAWKLDLMHSVGLSLPKNAILVPVDFERQTLQDELGRAGFEPPEKALFVCLGVVSYLTRATFRALLGYVANTAPGSGLVMDYGLPRSELPSLEQLERDSLASRVELAGEPFRQFFTPAEMVAELAGFQAIQDLGRDELNELYFNGRSDGLRILGTAGRLVSATV